MPTLMIPAERPWQRQAEQPSPQGAGQPRQPWQGGAELSGQGGSHPRRSRAVARNAHTARAGVWVWGQRALLALALILFLALGVLPRLGLYRPVTVLSGSMRPTFSPGDMVVVVPEPVSAVRVGQVISYQVPVGIHQVETHRIVKILQGGAHPTVQTQGDANNYHDPWTAKLEGNTAWRMVAVVPHFGYVVNFLRGRSLQMVAIFVAPALLALLLLAEIWGFGGGESESQPEPEGGDTRSATRWPAGQAYDRRRTPRTSAGRLRLVAQIGSEGLFS
jgi:signal peptidase